MQSVKSLVHRLSSRLPSRPSVRLSLRAALVVLVVAIAVPAAALNAKQFRSVAKALSPQQDVRVEQIDVKLTGSTDPVQAQLTVPATGVAGAPLCGYIAGRWECISVVQLSCPDKI